MLLEQETCNSSRRVRQVQVRVREARMPRLSSWKYMTSNTRRAHFTNQPQILYYHRVYKPWGEDGLKGRKYGQGNQNV